MEPIRRLLQEILEQEGLILAVFSDLRKKSLPYKKVTVRPLLLHGEIGYQAEYVYPEHVTHENLTPSALVPFFMDCIVRDFKQINLFTEEEDIQILAANPANPKISKVPATKTRAALSHNREKRYVIPDGEPCDFLVRLGVMDDRGKVFQKCYAKFRQINRFLEIVADVSDKLPVEGPLRIIDFGCGKAYLTFALYHYFTVIARREVSIMGLDLKKDVVAFCNAVSKDLHYTGLAFAEGDIAAYKTDSADMVVTLHACDTATDWALINAVGWRAKAILSVPCCQHQLFGQIRNTLHEPLFTHGILKDRFTEILTDGLRGLALEACGYDVAMIEFTSLEHTAKNIMIRATLSEKQNPDKVQKAARQYDALKDYWHVDPVIGRLLD